MAAFFAFLLFIRIRRLFLISHRLGLNLIMFLGQGIRLNIIIRREKV